VKRATLIASSLLAALAAVLAASPAVAAGCASLEARYDITLLGHTFGAVQSPDGSAAFATVVTDKPTGASGIAVLQCSDGRYAFSRLIPLEPQPVSIIGTRDGSLLLVADDAFVSFLDETAAIAGKPAFLGYLQDTEGDPEDNDAGSVEVNIAPDDRFAFVADESNNSITVIDIAKVRSDGFTRAAIVGQIPVANAPIALVFSHDGRYLFTTSEVALKKQNFPAACRQEGAGPNAPLTRPPGVIAAIDVGKAETDPEHSVVAQIPGDCSPVRMAISPNGNTLYVTNRNSNTVTAYSSARVIAGRSDALVASVAVGSGPVAIATTADGRFVLAGNTNRFGPGGTANGTISVISTATMKVVGSIPTGVFPREFSRGEGSTLFLSNNRSNTITVFDTSKMAQLMKPTSP